MTDNYIDRNFYAPRLRLKVVNFSFSSPFDGHIMKAMQDADYKQLQVHLKEVSKNPKSFEHNFKAGEILLNGANPYAALAHLQQAIKVNPESDSALIATAIAFHNIGMIKPALQLMAMLLQSKNLEKDKQNLELVYLLSITGATAHIDYDYKKIRQISEEYYKCVLKPGTKHFNYDYQPQHKKLRVAFFSPDLHRHPVGIYVATLAEHMDKSKFDLYAFYNNVAKDEFSEIIKNNCVKWFDTLEMSDAKLAEQVCNEEIDIVIDLAGHTNKNRMRALVYKPAPINIAWMGYFSTTGVPEIDYILLDKNIYKEEEKELFSEKVYELPHAYVPTELLGMDVEPLGKAPFEENGFITFGSLNHIRKMNTEVIELWSRVLLAVPSSKLLIKGTFLSNIDLQDFIRTRFEQHGVAKNRIMMEGRGTREEALETYNRIDIALDTFPFGGGLTSVENLLMSTPLVTWYGDRFMCRVSASLLKEIDCSELIAYDFDEFVRIAVELAADKEKIKEYKTSLKQKMLNSPCNAEAFAKQFQEALSKIWIEHHMLQSKA